MPCTGQPSHVSLANAVLSVSLVLAGWTQDSPLQKAVLRSSPGCLPALAIINFIILYFL